MPTRTLAQRARLAIREGRAALQWFTERGEHEEFSVMQALLASTSDAIREFHVAEERAQAIFFHATDAETDVADEQLHLAQVNLEEWVDALEYRTATRFGCSDEAST